MRQSFYVRIPARPKVTLTVGSLFSGIGGLDLGLERAGMEVIWQSEIDPYACKVLSKHWPKVVNHGNIKDIKWGDIVQPDIICGGYPCQPFSTAGKRNGADDPRHLWPWVREAISELRPRYAILENVRGHITLGLSTVLGELASIGYDAEWQIVSANSVGAPHIRDRIVIIAHPFRELANSDVINRQQQIFTPTRWLNALNLVGSDIRDVANSNIIGLERQRPEQQTTGAARSSQDARQSMADTDSPSRELKHEWQIQKPNFDGCSADVANASQQSSNGQFDNSGHSERPETLSKLGNCGWPQGKGIWAVEPSVGRVANGVPSRVDRLRGLGNAVVPQVAELIGRMVIDYDTNI